MFFNKFDMIILDRLNNQVIKKNLAAHTRPLETRLSRETTAPTRVCPSPGARTDPIF